VPTNKNIKRPIGGLNKDDSPVLMPENDYSDALNLRIGNSNSQNDNVGAETLQGEIEILLEVAAEHTYYGGQSIGGNFVYEGFDETVIGSQVWMKKNWDVDFPGSKAYNDNEDNADTYGRLYSHNQIMETDFVPDGWRIPTEADIDELLTYLGGAAIAGGKLKEYATNHWVTPNTGGTDEVGFKALPGGHADVDAVFELLQLNGFFWLLDEAEPLAPVALDATSIIHNTFTANWEAAAGATGYKLDVAEDAAFTIMVAGFDDLDVLNVLTYPVTGLTPDTDYFMRVRAYNEIGESANSNTIDLATLEYFADFDGNVYTYVTIGTQQWMVENFRSEHYIDGVAIPNLTLNADWIAEDGTPGHDGAMCYYDNDEATYKPDYGALYNWYAVDNAHGLAMAGWRVATDDDWTTLLTYLSNNTGPLKEEGTTHWLTPNTGATNTTGFTAKPGGQRFTAGEFVNLGEISRYWSSTEVSSFNAWWRSMNYDSTVALRTSVPKYLGLAVRLVRDT
jgi:uncharacterized protein (TIGR02145 family)